MILQEMAEELEGLIAEVSAWEKALNNEKRLKLLFEGLEKFSLQSFKIVIDELKQVYQESCDKGNFMPFPINARVFYLTELQHRKLTSPELKRSRQIIKQYEELENNKKPNRKVDYKLHPDYIALKKKLAGISKKNKKLFYLGKGEFKINQKELERRRNEVNKKEAEKQRQLKQAQYLLS